MSVYSDGLMKPEQVVCLRERYANKEGSLAMLGSSYGLSRNGAWLIVTGQTHKTAGGPITRGGPRHRHGPAAPRKMHWPDEVVRQIRTAVVRDGMTEAQAKRTFGMSQAHISSLVRGRTRPEAGGPMLHEKRPFLGEAVPWSVLTTAQVQEILLHHLRKDMTQPEMAAHYHVSRGMIAHIVYRRRWKHVSLPKEMTEGVTDAPGDG